MTDQPATKPPSKGTVTMPIRLKAGSEANQPALANYTYVSVAQGLAYVDFGFVEPSLISAILKNVHQGKTLPKHLDGTLTTRVALPLEALLRLQQQLAQVVTGLQRKLTA